MTKANYFAAVNPPVLPFDEARIKARETLLLNTRSEFGNYINSEYPDSYLKNLPSSTLAELGAFQFSGANLFAFTGSGGDPSYQSVRNSLAAQLMFFFYSQLNSIDQSIWREFLLRMDRGYTDDLFLGVVNRETVTDTLTTVNQVVTIGGIGVAVGAIAVGVAGAGAAGAAAGGATESGTLLGSVGLLGETGSTVTALEGAGLSLPALSFGGTELAGGGLLATIAAAANSDEGKKLLEQGSNLLFGDKKQPTTTQAVQTATQTQQDSLLKYLAPVSAALVLLKGVL